MIRLSQVMGQPGDPGDIARHIISLRAVTSCNRTCQEALLVGYAHRHTVNLWFDDVFQVLSVEDPLQAVFKFA